VNLLNGHALRFLFAATAIQEPYVAAACALVGLRSGGRGGAQTCVLGLALLDQPPSMIGSCAHRSTRR
jgi:hypothetical protein